MDSLKLSDLQELKSFTRPPENVQLVVFALLALFGEEETWANAKKFLGSRSELIGSISTLDVRRIASSRVRRLELYICNPMLTAPLIRMSSRAAYEVWKWLNCVHHEYKLVCGTSTSLLLKKKSIKKRGKRRIAASSDFIQPAEISHFLHEDSCAQTHHITDRMILEASHTLQTLTKHALSELRSFHNPPEVVKLVCFAVLTLFGEATSWRNAQTFLSQKNLVNILLSFDVHRVTAARAKRVQSYVNNGLLRHDTIKNTSAAALWLWEWVQAIHRSYLARGPPRSEDPVITQPTETTPRKLNLAIRGPVVTSRSMSSLAKRAPFPLAGSSTRSLPSAAVKKHTAGGKMTRPRRVDKTQSQSQSRSLCQPITAHALTELRSFSNPPEVVKHVCFAMLALFGRDPSWAHAVQFLNQRGLLDKIHSFDVDTITTSRAKRVRAYVNNDVLTRELIGKTSKAALALWEWVCATFNVYKMNNPLGHRRKRLLLRKKKSSFAPSVPVDRSHASVAAARAPTPQQSAEMVCLKLHSLAKDALSEMRSFQNPPEMVKLVCFSMLALFGEDTSWAHAVQFLNRKDLVARLMEFDVNSITRARASRVKAYVNNDVMTLDAIGRTSKAALCLWEWVCAVFNIYKMTRKRSAPSFY